MSRFSAANFSTAVAEMRNAYALFVSLDFDSGTRYLTTLPFDYAFGGHTYVGGGIILEIDPVSEQQGFASTQMLVRVQGEDYETIALGEDYHYREAILYWAFISVDTWQPLATPEELWRGFIDVMTIHHSEEERCVDIACEHEFINWRRSIGLINSDEHQRAYVDANDAFFNQAALVGQKPLNWGKGPINIVAGIAAAATAVVQSLVNQAGGIASGIASFVNPVFGAALGAATWGWSKYYDSMLAKQRAKIGSTQARQVNVTGGAQPAQIIYGEGVTHGQIVFVGTSGTRNENLWFVVVVASHQVEEIGDIWVDDRRISSSDINGSNQVTLDSFQESTGPCLNIWKFLGEHDDTALSELVTAFPGIWTSDHRGAGVAKVVFQCYRSDKAWPQGAPRSFKFMVKGKRCYNRRLDSTNGGSGSHRANDATTWEWTRNAEVITEDYMTSGSKYFSTATPLPLLGMGIASSRINGTFAASAANECDTLVDLPDALFLIPASHNTSITTVGSEVTVARVPSNDKTTTDFAYSTRPRTSIDLLITDVASGEVGITSSLGSTLSAAGSVYVDGYTMSIGGGNVEVYDGAVLQSTTGGVTGSTTFRIEYDGADVTFYMDATPIFTTAETRQMYIVVGVCVIDTAEMTVESQLDEQEEKYTCDIQLSADAEHQENLGRILQTMLGNITPCNGQFRIHAGTYSTPTKTITDSDVCGPVQVITHPAGEEVFNTVTGVFFDEARNWELVPFPPITNASYKTADGREFIREISLDGTRGSFRAQRISSQVLKQSRNKITIVFNELTPKAADIANWENFYLTLSELDYTSQVARCLQWTLMKNGSISIVCRLDASATYAAFDPADYVHPDAQPPSFAQTEIPGAPNALTVTSYAGSIGFVVGFADPLPAGTIVEIYEHTSSTPFSSATLVARGMDQTSFLISKNDTTERFYWAIAVFNGVESDNYPASTGASGRAKPALTPNALTATGIAGGITFAWGASGDQPPGTRWRLYEHTANTPFSSAVLVHETDSLSWTKMGDTPSAKFYWVKALANGTLSTEYPSGNGVSGQGLAPVAPNALTLTGFPTYIRAIVGFAATPPAGTIVELWEYTANTPFASATKIDEGEKIVFNIPKRDTTTRYYWARARLSGQTSTTFPSGNGTAGAADLVNTTDAYDNAWSETFTATTVSDTHTTDDFVVFLASSIGPYTFDVQLDVTATVDFDASGTWRAFVRIDDGSIHEGTNVKVVSTTMQQYSFDYTYTLPAGNTADVSIYAEEAVAGTLDHEDGNLRVVVRKK